MDEESKFKDEWISIFKKGRLKRDDEGLYSVSWTDEKIYSSKLNEGGRGMELSELIYFNGHLLAFDDRTGAVFELDDEKAIPFKMAMDGDGNTDKGFKTEWASIKDDHLYFGSTGKDWTDENGNIIHSNPLWVKTMDRTGKISSVNWIHNYERLRAATNTLFPGYLWHEAVGWNEEDQRWYLLPRRVSQEPYQSALNELKGSNIMISCDKNFNHISIKLIGELQNTRGFSSFKFIPSRHTEIVALKTEEYRHNISTYIMVFDLDGRILMPETKVADVKFEGIEFL